jgi:hypothetical protein
MENLRKANVRHFSKEGERVEKEHYCLQGHQASSTRPCDR